MTCIVGMIDEKNDKIIMASDSCSINDNNQIGYLKGSKIIQKNNTLIGVAGSPIGLQIIKRINEERFKLPIDDIPYLLMEEFKKYNALIHDEGSDLSPCYFLVARKNNIYEIDSEFCLHEFDTKYHAIGSGEKYALGYLTCITTFPTIEKSLAIRLSIECASRYCPDVGGNTNVLEI